MILDPEKNFLVDFADKKDVRIISVEIRDIYAGLLAGTRAELTKHLLTGKKKSTTHFELTEDQFEHYNDPEKRALRPYKYRIVARWFISEMEVFWFDYPPSLDIPLREIIAQHTAHINYDDHAQEIDW